MRGALLRDYKMNALIVSGIGAKPVQGFSKTGISAFFASRLPCRDVKSLVEGMVRREYSMMDPEQAYKGHVGCHGKPFNL